ncbi:MAG: metalloregulator ArsR/SmtB family transcription factor [Phycisphaerales bacterium]|jgi:ArsR family transcriptional regulator
MKRIDSQPMAERLAALAEPLRLRLLRLVEAQELSVGEIANVVQLPQSTVSRHLKVLADAGWLAKRHEGTATYFQLLADDLDDTGRSLWRAVRENAVSDTDRAEDERRAKAVVADRKTDSLSFFGRHSGEWDHLRHELFGGRFTTVALLSLLRRDWVVADLGCGTGNAAEFLSPFVEQVFAVDLSGPMLTSAKTRLASNRNVTFVEAGIEKNGLADASIDAAVCVLVLHHLEDPAGAVRETFRVLRTTRGGGVGLFVDMVSHDRDEYRRNMGHKHLGFSRQRVIEMLGEAGFADVVYHELPPEPQAKGPGLFVATGRLR